MSSPVRSTARFGPRGDYSGLHETGDLGAAEAGFAQHLGVVLAHPRRLAPDAGALPLGAKLDGQSRQAGDFTVIAAKAGNEHVYQTTGGEKVRVSEQIARLADR